MSQVGVDEPALVAAAERIAAEHAPANDPLANAEQLPDEPLVPSPEQQLAGYRTLSLAVIARGADALVPAWNVTDQEKTSLADACAQALLLWFPDQLIPPKYMALLVVAGVTLEIVDARRDPKTGALRPRVYEPPKQPAAVVAPAPAAAAS